jgi:uncharacterized protein YqeY
MEQTLREDLKKAQLMANEIEVATIRLVLSEMRNVQINKGESLSDEEIGGVIQKELKKRRESAQAFRQGNREELAEREEAEAAVLEHYLPAQLSKEELTQIVEQIITELGAKSIQDMGRVIGAVRGKVGQKAEGSVISLVVKEKLTPQ